MEQRHHARKGPGRARACWLLLPVLLALCLAALTTLAPSSQAKSPGQTAVETSVWHSLAVRAEHSASDFRNSTRGARFASSRDSRIAFPTSGDVSPPESVRCTPDLLFAAGSRAEKPRRTALPRAPPVSA